MWRSSFRLTTTYDQSSAQLADMARNKGANRQVKTLTGTQHSWECTDQDSAFKRPAQSGVLGHEGTCAGRLGGLKPGKESMDLQFTSISRDRQASNEVHYGSLTLFLPALGGISPCITWQQPVGIGLTHCSSRLAPHASLRVKVGYLLGFMAGIEFQHLQLRNFHFKNNGWTSRIGLK